MSIKYTNALKSLVVIIAVSIMGCGQGFTSSGGSGQSQSVKALTPNVNMDHIRAAASSAQTSLTNAQAALSQIINSDGSFNFGALFGGVNFGDLSTCVSSQFSGAQILFLPQDIGNALTCVFNDVVQVAGGAKSDMTNALAELNVAMGMVPAGSAEAIEMQTMITEVNGFETQYVNMVHSLATQISLATSFLNTLPTLAGGICPIPGLSIICGGAVSLLLSPIQTAISNFQIQMETI